MNWRAHWTEWKIAIRRSVVDQRARQFVARRLFLLIYVVGYGLYLTYAVRRSGPQEIAIYILAGVGVLAFLLLMQRSNRLQSEFLHTSIVGASHTPGLDSVSPEVLRYLYDRARILALMLVRSAGEIAPNLPQFANGVSAREAVNLRLRQLSLWDKLEPEELNLMSCAQGSWQDEQRNLAPHWSEQLRLLRWVLGVDAQLMPLAHGPPLAFDQGAGLLEPAANAPRATLPPWSIRVERDIALSYQVRLTAELQARGGIDLGPQAARWLGENRQQQLGASKDLLVRSRTIAELNDLELQVIGLTAAVRQQYATYLIDLIGREQPVAFSAWAKPKEAAQQGPASDALQ